MNERSVRFGHTDLPLEQQVALRKATRLEWITIGYMVSCVALIFLVMGSSQTMKAAWIEDMLALVPPIAFLIATRQARKPPSPEHPYGRHRSIASGHLAASTALLMVGVLLLTDSAMALIAAERPPIGTLSVLGHAIWAGWLMIAVLVYTLIGPIIIARLKMPLARTLHDRVLYADADMQKADWMTSGGSILGILGVGVGWWWADAVVAIGIAFSIVRDGWSNLRYALRGLMDGRARTFDNEHTHPLVEQVEEVLQAVPWAAEARSRVRDVGHLLHVEAFVVARDGAASADQLEQLSAHLKDLDWKIDEAVVMLVKQIPDGLPDPLADRD